MTRRNRLPKITECIAPAPRTISLNDSRITQTLVAFLILAILSVAHVYLRFTIRDMKLQHCKLQEQHQSLLQEQRRLMHESEVLCDATRLREFGRNELRMIEPDVRTQVVMSIPESMKRRYTEESRGKEMLADAAGVGGEVPFRQILSSLADVNKAFAAPGVAEVEQ